MSALNGSCTFPVLPDSGADISVGGLAMLECLNEHPDNLLSSSVTPRAVNGSTMTPIGNREIASISNPWPYRIHRRIPHLPTDEGGSSFMEGC